MKKLFVVALVCLFSTAIFAQSDSTKSKTTGYLSLGVSVSNGSDFKLGSYPSIEGGIMCENIGAGIVVGRGNFLDIGKNSDNIRNYYYEGKVIASFPIGILSSSVMFGYGGYIDTKHMFLEYGVGISYTKGKISYGVLCSNWDGITYMTPNITINF